MDQAEGGDRPRGGLCDLLEIGRDPFDAECPAEEVDTLLEMMTKSNTFGKGKRTAERRKIRTYYKNLEKNPPEPEPPPRRRRPSPRPSGPSATTS